MDGWGISGIEKGPAGFSSPNLENLSHVKSEEQYLFLPRRA